MPAEQQGLREYTGCPDTALGHTEGSPSAAQQAESAMQQLHLYPRSVLALTATC